MSANKTVTQRRSSRVHRTEVSFVGAALNSVFVPSLAPQVPQKWFPGGLRAAQAGQGRLKAAPHFPQNRCPVATAAWQAGHERSPLLEA
ncbi:MAG TPA: hypothetical protein VGK40_12990 [Verrucomicrobiae bacterium]